MDDGCLSDHLLLVSDWETARNTDMNKANAIFATLRSFNSLLM